MIFRIEFGYICVHIFCGAVVWLCAPDPEEDSTDYNIRCHIKAKLEGVNKKTP